MEFNEYKVVSFKELENVKFVKNTIRYKRELYEVKDNYYFDTNKNSFVILDYTNLNEENPREIGEIHNKLNMFVIHNTENYTEIFDLKSKNDFKYVELLKLEKALKVTINTMQTLDFIKESEGYKNLLEKVEGFIKEEERRITDLRILKDK